MTIGEGELHLSRPLSTGYLSIVELILRLFLFKCLNGFDPSCPNLLKFS